MAPAIAMLSKGPEALPRAATPWRGFPLRSIRRQQAARSAAIRPVSPAAEQPSGKCNYSGMKKISTPPLLKMRTLVSEDGRWARFFLLFKTGQNTAFSIPFSKIGLLLKALKTVIKTMADRIAARGPFSTEEVAEGLAEPITVNGIESGRDADTGDKLLWVETTDSGVFAFRLSEPVKEALADALHENETGDEIGRPATST
jgi:hypothetical protein